MTHFQKQRLTPRTHTTLTQHTPTGHTPTGHTARPDAPPADAPARSAECAPRVSRVSQETVSSEPTCVHAQHTHTHPLLTRACAFVCLFAVIILEVRLLLLVSQLPGHRALTTRFVCVQEAAYCDPGLISGARHSTHQPPEPYVRASIHSNQLASPCVLVCRGCCAASQVRPL
jgi:hypothetical protein